MDVMELRRMVMAQMPGRYCESGTFTCPDSDTTYSITFKKQMNRYLYLIEMTDESKTAFLNSGQTSARAFTYHGLYPKPSLSNMTSDYANISTKYNGSTSTVTGAVTASYTTTSTYIRNNVRAINAASSTNYYVRGYSYNYWIISLD